MNFRIIGPVVMVVLLLTGCMQPDSKELLPTPNIPLAEVVVVTPTSSMSPKAPQSTSNELASSTALIASGTNTLLPQTPSATYTPPINNPNGYQPINSGAKLSFSFVELYPGGKGWGGDEVGHILHTDDYGVTWKEVPPVPDWIIKGVFYAEDGSTAWAVSGGGKWQGYFWMTEDGGNHWKGERKFGEAMVATSDGLFYPVPQTLQILENGTGYFLWRYREAPHNFVEDIWTTGDKGVSWEKTNLGEYIGFIGAIWMADKQKGYSGVEIGDLSCQGIFTNEPNLRRYMSGELVPQIRHTEDGGIKWRDYSLPKASPEWVESIHDWIKTTNKDYSNECAYADTQIIQGTTDGGLGVRFEWRSAHDLFYYSPDGCETWRQWLSNGSEFFLNANTGWRLQEPPDASGSFNFQVTQDGGATWKNKSRVAWKAATFDFIDEQNGWAIASDGTNSSLLRTMDGGVTWKTLPSIAQ
jgi:photosystem II stability/assembly factor-like uncharacterized protein